jgi:hypothetical protein
MTTIKDFKLGADPEFFVKDGDKFVSAHDLVKGTKHNPLRVTKGAVQVDGMALEYNINAAQSSPEFIVNNRTVLNQLRDMVDPKLSFAFTPVAQFGYDYIQAQPEDAKKLGCTPDFNAYTGEENPPPDAEMPFRTASGHIHIGWTQDMDIDDPEHLEACRMMVKQLDGLLGCASVVWDPDPTRRQLYGKAGAFRPKSYGVEYRVMSNAWLNSDWQMDFVFCAAHYAFSTLLNGKVFFANNPEKVQKAINNSDVRKCYELASWQYGLPMQITNLYRDWAAKNKSQSNRDELGRWKKVEPAVKAKVAVA